MSSQKIKFEMNIEKLSFKFEGNIEQGHKIQSGISKALGDIASLQNGAMGMPSERTVEAKVIDTPALPVATRPRRRRRKSGSSADETRGENNDEGSTHTEDPSTGSASRKPSGASPKKLLVELRQDGFFEGGKGQGEIVAELDKRGHTKILPTSLPGALAKLVQGKVLSRDKSTDGLWVYSPGVNNG